MVDFVHLHTHTEYSLLDGAGRIRDLVAAAREQGMSALAITDHGVMYGVIDFYKAAKEAGIKPIIGCEVYVSPRSRFDKEAKLDDYQFHLVLLARDRQGYKNLMQLVSRGFTEGFYYKPRIDFELLEQYSEGLIALSGCLAGEIPSLILKGKEEEAREVAIRYRSLFGKENYYLEIQDHKLPEQKTVNKALIQMSKELDIPLVATNDVHYCRYEDAEFHDVLLCIQTGKTVDEEDRLRFGSEEFYFKSAEEMRELFPEIPEALTNTVRIAEMCNLEFDFSQTHLPQYNIPSGYTAKEYLRELCEKGLKEKYPRITPEIKERLDYELKVIDQMGYNSYFLIVWDFVRYAHENNILVGPGRGSAAGSLVAYALSITNIDPLRYGLLFERFLNPERVTMPDIDIDFCYEKREKVINYVVEKYGAEQVAQIITFGTMAARGAVRDVGRALNFTYSETDRIAKLIPFELGMTIDKAMEQNQELGELYNSDQRYRKLLDLSRMVEGLSRHASTHAAGVVIAKEPLVNYVPLQRTSEGFNVTQFPMGTLEELGLLKMDFLGLRTLTMMEEAVKNIKHNRGVDVDLARLLDDEKTFELLSQGDTIGIFQLESSGMRSVLKELKPNKFEDIIAVVALYRPGPMDQIPTFIKNKHGQNPITYLHPDLEPILKETYGIMVYQEQIMQVAAKMAGFSLGQADLLRRAIGKKNKEILDQQKELFVEGCIKNGYDKKMGIELYDLILKFASYGFNKSHAAAYAMIAYQTAYLKANYPLEFMAALLTTSMASSDKVALYITDCRRRGIEVLPPDINESYTNFTVIGGKRIRFGLAAVKNVGLGAIESIIQAREKGGRFRSLRDFCNRVNLRVCNKKTIESLIKSGAFDSLKVHRAQLLAILDETLSRGQSFQRERDNGQLSVFAIMGKEEAPVDNLPDIPEFSTKEKLSMEKEMLGLYISGHPLEQYSPLLEKITKLTCCAELKEMRDQAQVTVGGIIQRIRSIYTKKGRPMAFLTLEDLTGEVEVIVFSNLYERQQKELEEDLPLLIKGKTDIKDEEEVKIICEKIIPLPLQPKRLFLRIGTPCQISTLLTLKELLRQAEGGIPVYLFFEKEKKTILVEEDCWATDEPDFLQKVKNILGADNVKLQELRV
ncbi:MAG: DNA polymerase III subunit alpha [Dethiobacteria bacterium]